LNRLENCRHFNSRVVLLNMHSYSDSEENEGRTPLLSKESMTVRLISADYSHRPRRLSHPDDFEKISVNIDHVVSCICLFNVQ
ncbi:putative solute carrier family 11, partial [Schistosoma japonicum]